MRLVLNVLLILVIVATVLICTVQPEMHKSMIVYDSDYTLVTEQEVKTETKDVPVMEMPSAPVQKTTVVEKKVEPVVAATKTQTTNVKQQTKTTPKQITTTKQTVTKPQNQTVTKPVTTKVIKPQVIQQTQTTETSKVEKKVVNNPSPQPSPTRSEGVITPKVLTQQEETIAWNRWRSALTNQIMQDTKLPPIPNGVLFQFSFNVDKYGTPYAIQYIAPVIRSYQGRSILNFPEGTARTSTQVTGKWRISNTEKYSTPQDYHDVEKVIR